MPIPRLEIRVRDRRSGAATDHSFMHGPVRIGRDPACELPLADPYVSNQHALLATDERGARLVDLGGTNGLRVAGRRLAPRTEIPVGERLCVSLGPFDLEVVHTPDRDRQAVSGAVVEPGPVELERLHASLRRLHALHAPHVAARQAFEAALADTIHTFHGTGDQPAIRRILAEFPTADHAHLILPTPPRAAPQPPASPRPPASVARREPQPLGPPNLSLRTPSSAPGPHDLSPRTPSSTPDSLDAHDLSLRTPSCAPHSLDTPAHRPDAHDLSLRTPPLDPSPANARPPAPHQTIPAATAPAPALALIADAAQTLLPDRRPPANLDEARRFFDRLISTLRSLAAGVGALQHLRLQQARDLDLSLLDLANPLLTRTSADELLADLLAWRED
ncbi:MAG TPA: FHA domain-containing protein, partial [Nannocystis sp.]